MYLGLPPWLSTFFPRAGQRSSLDLIKAVLLLTVELDHVPVDEAASPWACWHSVHDDERIKRLALRVCTYDAGGARIADVHMALQRHTNLRPVLHEVRSPHKPKPT